MIMMSLLFGCSDRGFTLVRDDPLPSEPDIVVSPGEVSIAPRPLGCDAAQIVRIDNRGAGPLDVSGTWIEGADDSIGAWSVEFLEQTILSGGSQEFVLGFDPRELGDIAADLVVESDDPDEPEVRVPLSATAYDPTWQLDVFDQAPDPIDVLWVIDNSGSMWQEKDRVTSEINQFFQWFVALDLDYHMGVVATDVVNPAYQGRLYGEPSYVTPDTPDAEAALALSIDVPGPEMGNEAGLLAMEWALSDPLVDGDNAGFYRENARLVVIFLSDEAEQSTLTADDYIAFLDSLKPDRDQIFLGAIVGDREHGCDTSCDGDPQDAQEGDKYLDVAEAFDGFEESICSCNLAPALEQMGFESTWYVRSFPLSGVPGREDMITVWVDSVEASGWTYDADANAVVFETAPPLGSEIVARYPVDLECP